jgi:hypothetical protein
VQPSQELDYPGQIFDILGEVRCTVSNGFASKPDYKDSPNDPLLPKFPSRWLDLAVPGDREALGKKRQYVASAASARLPARRSLSRSGDCDGGRQGNNWKAFELELSALPGVVCDKYSSSLNKISCS